MIELFKGHISALGISRQNRFRVIIPVPVNIVDDLFDDETLNDISSLIQTGAQTYALSLMCTTAQTNGRTINLVDSKNTGSLLQFPSGITKEPVELTFILTEPLLEQRIIDNWLDTIVDPYTGEMGYMDEYTTDIDIEQLSNAEGLISQLPVYRTILHDAYPVSRGPLVYDNSSQNTFHTMNVSFTYKRSVNGLDLSPIAALSRFV